MMCHVGVFVMFSSSCKVHASHVCLKWPLSGDLLLVVPRIPCALDVGAEGRDHGAADVTEALHDTLRRQTGLGVVIPALLDGGAQQMRALREREMMSEPQ